MASFLYAFGIAICEICLGLLIKFASKQITNEYKASINLIGNIIIYSGAFYMLYVLLPIKDYSNEVYFSALAALSVGVSFIIVGLNKAILFTEEKLKFYKQALDLSQQINAKK